MNDTTKHLLRQGFRTKQSRRLFSYAAWGKVNRLRRKLDRLNEAEILSDDHFGCKFSLLHFASSPEIAELLLSRGYDLNKQDQHGNTPLHYQALEGNAEMVTFLLEQGANPQIVNRFGQTPLELASTLRIAEIISGNRINDLPIYSIFPFMN